MESLESTLQNKALATTALALGLSAILILAYAVSCYREYVSFGPHGLPDNFRGWLKQLSWHAVARSDTRVPVPYAESELGPAYTAETRKSYFAPGKTPPERSGPRPVVRAG